jgi:hypothetical protein
MKAWKKKTHHKTKPKQKRKNTKTQNPSSFSLFNFVVLLLVDFGATIVTILLLCFKKWLPSYVPPCHENWESIENRVIVNPRNGTVTRLLTMPFHIEMELEPFFLVS